MITLQVIPKAIAENAGAKGQETLSQLIAVHKQDNAKAAGFDCEKTEINSEIVAAEILDSWYTKRWALEYATNAACQILCVDEIIMAKRAGGPKPRGMGAQDPDDDE